MKRQSMEFIGSKGETIVMDVRLTFGGWVLLGCAHFSAHVLRWLPPVEHFKAAMKRHTEFRLNGGPWVRWREEWDANYK